MSKKLHELGANDLVTQPGDLPADARLVPATSAADNDKVLTVVSGAPAWAAKTARVVVMAETKDGTAVTGQTVTVYRGASADPTKVYETKPYEGEAVAFDVPQGFQYFVAISDALAGHFLPTTAAGTALTDVYVTLVYGDFDHLTFGELQLLLPGYANDDAARAALVGKEIADTWTDPDATGTGTATPSATADNHPIYEDPFVITDVRQVEDAEGAAHRGAVLLRQYASKKNIVFDAPNTAEASTDAGGNWVSDGASYYYGQTGATLAHNNLTLLNPDGPVAAGEIVAAAGSYAKVYKNKYRLQNANIPFIAYGHNRYENSAVRKYINSSGSNWFGTWPLTTGQTKPAGIDAITGYKSGCSPALLAAAKAVKHTVVPIASITPGNEPYTVCDQFFLPSSNEMYAATRNAAEGSDQADYWKLVAGDDALARSDDSAALNAVRTVYSIEDQTTARQIRLRTAHALSSHWTATVERSPAGKILSVACVSNPYMLVGCVVY